MKQSNNMKKIIYKAEYLLLRFLVLIFHILGYKISRGILKKFFILLGMRLKHSKIARNNLARIFPHKNTAEIEYIIFNMWGNLSSNIVAILFPKHNLLKIRGAEHLHQAQALGNGVILFSAHFCNWELFTQSTKLLNTHITFTYRYINNPYINQWIKKRRANSYNNMVNKDAKGARELVSVLKKGGVIGMLLDQKMNEGISVPFLDIPAMTSISAAKFHLKFNSIIIPTYMERNGDEFQLVIEKALEFSEKADEYMITLAINEKIGEWVKNKPEEWFWLHQRWGKESFD